MMDKRPRSCAEQSARCSTITAFASTVLFHATFVLAGDPTPIHLRCEGAGPDSVRLEKVVRNGQSVGPIKTRADETNTGSWRFDGRTSIAYVCPSNRAGFAENFTWEGFFLSPKSNAYSPETGITDRLVTQFAFDKGNWTRLAIGLVADRDGQPRLSVELEGFEGRTFGLGDRVMLPDRWHHFALVHEGTASAATIRWFLDYKLTGQIFLGGQANQNTLRPPGSAPMTIGARLRAGGVVNRGFDGLVDEVRLSPRSLSSDDFLRPKRELSETVGLTVQHEDWKTDSFWDERHEWAQEQARGWLHVRAAAPIDPQAALKPVGDASFLRRLSLTVRGRIPGHDEVRQFLSDSRVDKRARAIDRMLASPEWADGWVGYWQDVLAENPSVVFPTLNNSGPFRQWIYESFLRNKPMDRFVTELIMMETDDRAEDDATPKGFGIATANDAPMAMRAHVVLKAFAAVNLKCARCHDSPVDRFRQADLFLLSAYLNDGSISVPGSSLVAAGLAGSSGVITSSLSAGQEIRPVGLKTHWLRAEETAEGLLPVRAGSPRAELAALITSPRNSRFSDVIVNRVWQRYFGRALAEPVNNWNGVADEAPAEKLRELSARFVAGGYDMKNLARWILNSEEWQTGRATRQRMSAEQLVDSLFVAVGKTFQGETLGINATDPGAVHLPRPERAWQFAALPNERDRPALGMPVNQTIVDVMRVFGWSGHRQQPRSERDQASSPLQALALFNGLMSQRIVRLSEDSAITELCLESASADDLVSRLFLTVLSRRPNADERSAFVAVLAPTFETRRTGLPARPSSPLTMFQPDWRKHLEPEQTRLMLQAQKRVAAGQPPTARLTDDFRERVEDILWALLNSPEFVVVP